MSEWRNLKRPSIGAAVVTWGALFGVEISHTELITINALAKATGDAFTYGLTQRLLASMTTRKNL